MAAFLVKATVKKGDDYSLLQNMYEQLVAQRNRELSHVVSTLGGSVETNLGSATPTAATTPSPATSSGTPSPSSTPRRSRPPASLVLPDILDRLEANGVADRILTAQSGLLRQIITDGRAKRMAEQVARNPKSAYSPQAMLGDLRKGIFSELKADPVDIDLYRRNLQRSFVEILDAEVGREVTSSDLPALTRFELSSLLNEVQALPEAKDERLGRGPPAGPQVPDRPGP